MAGIGNSIGALVGGLIIGISEGIGSVFLPTAFRDGYGMHLPCAYPAVQAERPSGRPVMRFVPLAALLCALVAPLVIKSDSTFAIVTFGFLLASLAVSFNLIFGFTGQLSFFHAASFGVAAYMTAILVGDYGLNFWVAILAAILVVAVLSVVVGTICFRFKLREFYFAVVTLAFSEMIRLVVVNWNSVTNGTLGITVTVQPILWLPSGPVALSGPRVWYYVSLSSFW